MKRFLTSLILLATIGACHTANACTSAIFSGKSMPDGRPILWKHRDTGETNNRVQYYKGEKYDFIALVNSPKPISYHEAWTGTNSAGFSIMNTASYNLKDDDVDEKLMDKEGEVMWKALSTCATLQDFERMLDKLPRPIGVETNFGVIDAHGGAAYYEVNNHRWTKVDANDPAVAPNGYLIYTNHSRTGRLDEGNGYIRHANAEYLVGQATAQRTAITPEWIFTHLSQSYRHGLLGIDLVQENDVEGQGILQRGTGFFIDQDFIPRRNTAASIVIKGVKEKEDPSNTVMWTMLGYPATATVMPLFVKAKDNQPGLITMQQGHYPTLTALLAQCGFQTQDTQSMACNLSLCLKADVFPIRRGNGSHYFNFNLIHNPQGTGFMQQLAPLNHQLMAQGIRFAESMRDKPYDNEAFNAFYQSMTQQIIDAYTEILKRQAKE